MHTQIAYSTIGQKLALMSSQTLQKAMVPLTGKSLALYNSSGLLYYAHSDMLGSIRLGTTPGRTMYFDTAYAPFGEPYASIGTLDPSYTGQTNDTSSYRQDTAGGLYDFPLREYSTQGRWPNPDPLGRTSTCPKDPQTQNRYAYVRNNPITYTDPTGGMGRPLPPPRAPCDPDDPYCGCDPDDPFCDPCVFEPWLCYPYPIGGGGGGGGFTSGGGGSPEQPRPFPWPLLPPLFFASEPGSAPKPCTIKVLTPKQVPNGFNSCADEGWQLIWALECVGDYNCCIGKQKPYQQACETPAKQFYYIEDFTYVYNLGLCCKKGK